MLHLTKLYDYFIIFYYWLLFPASKGHHQANICKKKKKT